MCHSRFSLLLLLVLRSVLPVVVSCGSVQSHFVHVTDLPLKELELPSMSWQASPLRSHAQYVLYGAQSGKQVKGRLGDYYFVDWYDAEPSKPAKLEMVYTQALTASERLYWVQNFKAPRGSRGTRKTLISFNGPERAKRGDVLSWRLNLYVDGKLVDSRRSYLWKDRY